MAAPHSEAAAPRAIAQRVPARCATQPTIARLTEAIVRLGLAAADSGELAEILDEIADKEILP